MSNTDPRILRPVIDNTSGVAHAVNELRQRAHSPSDLWRLLTESFVVDLDAVATLLPAEEPETVWLAARG